MHEVEKKNTPNRMPNSQQTSIASVTNALFGHKINYEN